MIDLPHILRQAELRERGEPSTLSADDAVELSYLVISLANRLRALEPDKDLCAVCASETFDRPGPRNEPDWSRRRCTVCGNMRGEP